MKNIEEQNAKTEKGGRLSKTEKQGKRNLDTNSKMISQMDRSTNKRIYDHQLSREVEIRTERNVVVSEDIESRETFGQ